MQNYLSAYVLVYGSNIPNRNNLSWWTQIAFTGYMSNVSKSVQTKYSEVKTWEKSSSITGKLSPANWINPDYFYVDSHFYIMDVNKS